MGLGSDQSHHTAACRRATRHQTAAPGVRCPLLTCPFHSSQQKSRASWRYRTQGQTQVLLRAQDAWAWSVPEEVLGARGKPVSQSLGLSSPLQGDFICFEECFLMIGDLLVCVIVYTTITNYSKNKQLSKTQKNKIIRGQSLSN